MENDKRVKWNPKLHTGDIAGIEVEVVLRSTREQKLVGTMRGPCTPYCLGSQYNKIQVYSKQPDAGRPNIPMDMFDR